MAKTYGAEVPFIRPSELADDFTGTDAVVLHALKCLLDGGEKVNYVCCIYATAPFVRPEDIRKGYEQCNIHIYCDKLPIPYFQGIKD